VVTHIAIGFAIAYGVTGSVLLGGLALLAEPVINVLLLPLHERLWEHMRERVTAQRLRYAVLAGEKLSQTAMHMLLAFGVMGWATGSMAIGGLAAVLEPVCNVVLLPLHDRAWEVLRAKWEPAPMTT
jgi:uncharacterized membrane protein